MIDDGKHKYDWDFTFIMIEMREHKYDGDFTFIMIEMRNINMMLTLSLK